MKLIKTDEVVTIEDYPYGFKLRCTLIDSMEFNPKKGYRHVTQTTDPRTGRKNAPKKSTYSTISFRFYNENGHIKQVFFDLNGDESINKATAFLFEHFDILSPDEVRYMYSMLSMMSLISCKASVIYCGSKADDIKLLYGDFWATCKKGIQDGLNHFDSLVLDCGAIDATQDPNFNPFTTTTHTAG